MTDVVSVPNEESIRAAFAEAERESAFWREHYDTYLTQYPDQFVAIAKADHHVVATSPDLLHLVGVIEGRSFSVRDVWVQFMAATPRHLML